MMADDLRSVKCSTKVDMLVIDRRFHNNKTYNGVTHR